MASYIKQQACARCTCDAARNSAKTFSAVIAHRVKIKYRQMLPLLFTASTAYFCNEHERSPIFLSHCNKVL
ncbi:hypothetical protein A3J56_03170 [Candidatus Giovannonibacteria bacterium RIFCSPHIGHO2_02_FULL_46_20]|uniref:Uncharacterized protein n=1 Tax=Candidatus Giovannonibacteria bacterium RIFCSPHIGHO2_02_FULL_46_20 TaxID=1798338 RepID=A0A1F5WEV2_9BACT|nr:MAG: hypothetical protein A3J56_03170 [Candidatus Giovannonibacteria bacterium RIFCSPHIGHO2_02_FULL_46_20]